MHLLCIIRNPLSVLSSFFKAPSEFNQSWKIEDEWLDAPSKNNNMVENYYGYSKWKEATFEYHRLAKIYGDRVTIVNYKDLLSNTLPLIEKIFSIYDMEVTNQTSRFIKESKNFENPNPYSVFKVKQRDDKWKELIPQKIVEYIYNDLKGTELEIYLK